MLLSDCGHGKISERTRWGVSVNCPALSKENVNVHRKEERKEELHQIKEVGPFGKKGPLTKKNKEEEKEGLLLKESAAALQKTMSGLDRFAKHGMR